MEKVVKHMLDAYEDDKISRRTLIGFLAGCAMVGRASASEPIFHAVSLNHVTLNVSDVQRSRDFYSKLLGLPLLHEAQNISYLGLGKSFLCLVPQDKSLGFGVDHYCLGIDDFGSQSVLEKLKQQGLNTKVDGDQVYFRDPDGILVQLSSVDYQG